MQPRLSRSSWRDFASIHLLRLFLLLLERFSLLAHFSSCNIPAVGIELALSSHCSRSDPPLSRQRVALAHLDSLPSHDLMILTDGFVPFPFGKGNSGVFANCSFCGTEATLLFLAGLVCSSFPLKSGPALELLAPRENGNLMPLWQVQLLKNTRQKTKNLYNRLCRLYKFLNNKQQDCFYTVHIHKHFTRKT